MGKSKIKSQLNVIDTFAFIINALGGNSIFIVVGTTTLFTGSVGMSLVAVFITGLLHLSLSRCFLEVALLLPQSGGPYFYIHTVFGPMAAFLFIWMYNFLMLGPIMALPAYACAASLLQLGYPNCVPPKGAVVLIALCILLCVVIINCLYLNYVTKVQKFLSFSKIIGMLLITTCGVYNISTGNVGVLQTPFEGTKIGAGDFSLGLLAAYNFWGGWPSLYFMIGLIKTPARTLLLAIGSSFAVTFVLFELSIASYYTILSTRESITADAIAVIFMDRVWPPLSPVIAVFTITTSLGMLCAAILGPSRMFLAAAKQGQLHPMFAMTSQKYKMPQAVIIAMVVYPAFLLIFSSVKSVIIYAGIGLMYMFIMVLLCVLVLRWQKPNDERPFKVWLITPVVQMILHIAVLVSSLLRRPSEVGTAVIIVLLGIPVYLATNKWKHRPPVISQRLDKLAILAQKMFLLEK